MPLTPPKLAAISFRLEPGVPGTSAIPVRAQKVLTPQGVAVLPDRSTLRADSAGVLDPLPLVVALPEGGVWPPSGGSGQPLGLTLTLRASVPLPRGSVVATWSKLKTLAASITRSGLYSRMRRTAARARTNSYGAVVYRSRSKQVSAGPAGDHTVSVPIPVNWHRIGRTGRGITTQRLAIHWRPWGGPRAYRLGVIEVLIAVVADRPKDPWIESPRGSPISDQDVREDVLLLATKELGNRTLGADAVHESLRDRIHDDSNFDYAPTFGGGGGPSFLADDGAGGHILDLTRPAEYLGPKPPTGGMLGECRDYAAVLQAYMASVGVPMKRLRLDNAVGNWFVCNPVRALGDADFRPVANPSNDLPKSWWEYPPDPNLRQFMWNFGLYFHVVPTFGPPLLGTGTPPVFGDSDLAATTFWDLCFDVDNDGQADVVHGTNATQEQPVAGMPWTDYASAVVGVRAAPQHGGLHSGIHDPIVSNAGALGVMDGVKVALPPAVANGLAANSLNASLWFTRTITSLTIAADAMGPAVALTLRVALEQFLNLGRVPMGWEASLLERPDGVQFVYALPRSPAPGIAPPQRLVSWDFAFDPDSLGRLGPPPSLTSSFAAPWHGESLLTDPVGWIWHRGRILQLVVQDAGGNVRMRISVGE